MKSLLIIALVCFTVSLKAQLSVKPIFGNNNDTTYLFADFMYTSPTYTYFKIHDTIYRLETSKFVNTIGIKQIDDSNFQMDMYRAFKSAKNSYSFGVGAASTLGLSTLFLLGAEPLTEFFIAGAVVSSGLYIGSLICHVKFLNTGKRAGEKAIAIDYNR